MYIVALVFTHFKPLSLAPRFFFVKNVITLFALVPAEESPANIRREGNRIRYITNAVEV